MSIQKLERVLRRIRAENPGKTKISIHVLHRAVCMEVGTDPRTLYQVALALKRVGWIKTEKFGKWIILTGKDLTDS